MRQHLIIPARILTGILAGFGLLVAAANPVSARDGDWRGYGGRGHGAHHHHHRPHYYAPQPVYRPYYPPPAIYYAPPAYYAPPVYLAPPVIGFGFTFR